MEKWVKETGQWIECSEERVGDLLEYFYDSSKLHKIYIQESGGESFLYRTDNVKDDLDLGQLLEDGVLVYSIKECLNGEYPHLFPETCNINEFLSENLELFSFTKVSGGIVVSFMNKNIFLYGMDN